MRVSLGLGLAILIVLVQPNRIRNGASLPTLKETTTLPSPPTLLGEHDDRLSLGSQSKSKEKTSKERKEDEELTRQLEPKHAPSTERNSKNTNIPGELENGQKTKSEDLPIFKAHPFEILIPDNLPVSSVLGKVEAADPTNQGRKCFYHLTSSTHDLFSVDTDTGVITTKESLDNEDDPVTISHYLITISTAFHNFTDKSFYDDKFHLKSIHVPVKVHHGPLRDLLFGKYDKKSAVAPFSWDGVKHWILIIAFYCNITIFLVIVIVILLNIVDPPIDEWNIEGNDSRPTPTCVQVARNFLKRCTKHHCGENQTR